MQTTYPNVFPCTVQYEDERASHIGLITEARAEDSKFLVDNNIVTTMIVDEPHFMLIFKYGEGEDEVIRVKGHSKLKPTRNAVAEGVGILRMAIPG